MTRTIALACAALLAFGAFSTLVAGCGAPAAQLDDDAAPELSVEERARTLRAEVDAFEGRRVLELDAQALARMRAWLDEMEDAGDDEAEAYEQAVRAQLDYLRTSEILHYPDDAGVTP